MKTTVRFLMAVAALAVAVACRQQAGAADEKKAPAKAEAKKEPAKKAEAKKGDEKAAPGKKTAAELEKEKALASPYPNDLGPDNIDKIVKDYPKQYAKGYELLKLRCSKCHAPSRPLNSRFLEVQVPGKDDAEKDKNIEKWKQEHPEISGEGVWQVEHSIWKRYVKRMAAKPGCDIAGPEAKAIWEFVVYDSLQRKTGANAAKWKAHREDLIQKFKEQHPARYEELKEQKDL